PMQKLFLATIVLATLTIAIPVSAQDGQSRPDKHRAAVLLTGSVHGASFSGLGADDYGKEFRAKPNSTPGAEILFKPASRVSFGFAITGPMQFQPNESGQAI